MVAGLARPLALMVQGLHRGVRLMKMLICVGFRLGIEVSMEHLDGEEVVVLALLTVDGRHEGAQLGGVLR